MLDQLAMAPLQTLAGTAFLVYLTGLYGYRLLLHPLRNFPGERLAAISEWHWCCHAKDASSYLTVLHQKYGVYHTNRTL